MVCGFRHYVWRASSTTPFVYPHNTNWHVPICTVDDVPAEMLDCSLPCLMDVYEWCSKLHIGCLD